MNFGFLYYLAGFALVAAAPQSVLPPDQPAAIKPVRVKDDRSRPALESLRSFMLTKPVDVPTSTTKGAAYPDEFWIRYLAIPRTAPPDQRERALRDLLDSDIPDSLRQVVLRDIASDVSFQSDRARFVRRYGFYSTWFNRISYTTTRALQGNLQAFGQLFVDGVFDIVRSGDTSPAERRLYKLLGQMDAEGRAEEKDKEELARLEKKINEAMAEIDIERAEWALGQDRPEIARFYARGALGLAPAEKKAAALERKADSEIARRARGAVASAQTGYPDRKPPIEDSSPELLRAALARKGSTLAAMVEKGGKSLPPLPSASKPALPSESANAPQAGTANEAATPGEFKYPGDLLLAWMTAALTSRDDASPLEVRGWSSAARKAGKTPPSKTAWLQQHLLDPRFNPDVRLARAQASRRGHLARFIFAGPESERERAYEYSSQLAQMWKVVSSIGIFYGFEVMYRAGLAVISPPPPADEIYDAEAAFLRAEPDRPESTAIAHTLAERYADAGRFDQARALLEKYGGLEAGESQKLFQREAKRLLARAEEMPPNDPRREPMLKKVTELAPGSGLSESAMKDMQKKPEPAEKLTINANWSGLGRWLGFPPAGLPCKAEWFDGNPTNGEVEAEPIVIEAAGSAADTAQLTYAVQDEGERKIVQEKIDLKGKGELARWIRLTLAEKERQQNEIKQFGKTAIPYEVKGGLGPSGVDFYPKLLPIEGSPGELRLFQN